MNPIRSFLTLLAFAWVPFVCGGIHSVEAQVPSSNPPDATSSTSEDELGNRDNRGETIYRSQCASCHGERGEGVAEHYADPLVGDSSVRELAKRIHDTMPEGEPEKCIDSDALAVAHYIFDSFYSEAAQIRNRPPKIGLARLTGNQLRNSLADLYGSFESSPALSEARGLRAVYYQGARKRNDSKKIERIDPKIDFDFGHDAPGEGIEPKSFAIQWDGALLAESTGRYELIVRSTCSFVMDFGKIGREWINNHVQSGDKTEFRRSVSLISGRTYPIKIDFIQRERKTEQPPARIQLSWIRPNGVEEVIPTRNLIPSSYPGTFSLESNLPPDDRSYGFERGVAINREWDSSTTSAAIEFSQVAVRELWPEFRRKHKNDGDENRGQLRRFLSDLISVAFRGDLDESLKKVYIDQQVDATLDDAEAIKRTLLLALKSPRFLYPTADHGSSMSQRHANRFALVLMDSLPADPSLRKQIGDRGLEVEEGVRLAIRQMTKDPRTLAKIRDLFHEWLNIKHLTDITKDPTNYPGFDPFVVQDLRGSIDAFLDEVVQSETSDYRQLFTADWTWTTDRLESFYGPDWKPRDEDGSTSGLRKSVSTPSRLGLLSHPYLLSGFSYHNATSPIHRGIFLYRTILGRTLRPPKEAFAPLSPDLHPNLTTRERVDLQTSAESCQVCHRKINGLGFVLENFDPVGRFREMEKNKPIDPQGTYVDRAGKEFRFKNPKELADFIITSEDAHRAFVSRVFLHMVKQPIAAYGPKTLDDLVESFRKNHFHILKLIEEIAVLASLQDPTLTHQEI